MHSGLGTAYKQLDYGKQHRTVIGSRIDGWACHILDAGGLAVYRDYTKLTKSQVKLTDMASALKTNIQKANPWKHNTRTPSYPESRKESNESVDPPSACPHYQAPLPHIKLATGASSPSPALSSTPFPHYL